MPFCPKHWKFQASEVISDIQILGTLRPQLHINLHGLQFVNTVTGRTLTCETPVRLSWYQAYQARCILLSSYNSYLLLGHFGYAFHFGIARYENENPAGEDHDTDPPASGSESVL